MYLHIHLMKAGVHPDPLISPFEATNSIYRRYQMIRNMKRPVKKFNLLAQENQSEHKQEDENDLVPYWYPEVVINLVNIDENISVGSMPVQIRRYIFADRIRKAYYPIMYVNEFWELKSKRQPFLDASVKELPLKIRFSTTSFFKFTMMCQAHHTIQQTEETLYGHNNEFEKIKRMLLETAPWLIALTAFVSLLHLVLDFLAFKNGNQYYTWTIFIF